MFEWDAANIAHIARREFTPEEIESVFADIYAIAVPAYAHQGELRYGIVGLSSRNRMIAVFFIFRGLATRVVTARPARHKEREAYYAGR